MSQLILLAGSLRIDRLPAELVEMVDDKIQHRSIFCVGDAPGADLLFQRLLLERGRRSVTVYHSDSLRNNLGKWPTVFVESNLKSKGKDRHTVKDRQMCRQALEGIVAWDGQSSGTLANVFDLAAQGKSCHVFLGSKHVGSFSSAFEVEQFCDRNLQMKQALTEAKARLERFHKRESKIDFDTNATLF